MAYFLLSFDDRPEESSALMAKLDKISHSLEYPSASKIAPGSWLVVEPSTAKAKDVWFEYKRLLTGNVALSVLPITIAGVREVDYRVSDETNGWVQRWQLVPDKQLVLISGLA